MTARSRGADGHMLSGDTVPTGFSGGHGARGRAVRVAVAVAVSPSWDEDKKGDADSYSLMVPRVWCFFRFCLI